MDPRVKAPIHKNRRTTLEQVGNFVNPGNIFKDINLTSQLYGAKADFTSLSRFSIPQPEPPNPPHGSWQAWKFSRVIAEGTFVPASVGEAYGPTWSTHWFKVVLSVPAQWGNAKVHLRWVTGSESTIYDESGKLLQGINPKFREEFPLPAGTTTATYYIEMACNHIMGAGPDYRNGWGDEITPPSPNLFFTLSMGHIAVFNENIFQLMTDLEILNGMATHLGESHIGNQALFVANQMVNEIRLGNHDDAASLATTFFSQTAGAKTHQLYAMGHCHIDTAWLWPYNETRRKCARSFSAQLRLMDEYPDYKFVCSQAIQLAWIKDCYIDLFNEIKTYVDAAKTKQFLLVGGTWVELDGNVPSGESFMRQYFYGQEFFRKEFGVVCEEFWLPDTFGYSAQIPQMLNHVGIRRFLTQKMSWNLINKFPNHNFIWEGIDGSQVVCHFPPGDSYGMSGSVEEFLKSQNNSEDKGRCNSGVYLFGHGDGGGGPTRTIIERIKRVENVDGMPKVKFSYLNEFFEAMEAEEGKFYKWVGELYLELHNGTYTTQSKIKWYNRKGEFFLREVEALMCIAHVLGKVADLPGDKEKVDSCWKDLLLNQFHDVLPGSCIQLVAEEAWRIYEKVFTDLRLLRDKYTSAILSGSGPDTRAIYNPLPWPVKTVIFTRPDEGPIPSGPFIQDVTISPTAFEDQGEGRFRIPNRFAAALVDLGALGFTQFVAVEPQNKVQYQANTPSPGTETFTNGLVTLEVTPPSGNGQPVERILFGTHKEPAYRDFGGKFYIFDDLPMIWDAWDVMDYHLETKREPDFSEVAFQNIAQGDVVGCYRWRAKFGNESTIEKYAILRADSPMIEYFVIVDWKESHKILKVEFPLDVLARNATFEIQYGHTKRPNHTNTTWDMAKFEVCGHKWMDMSQADKGVSIISDCKYGWHVRDSVVQLSLLRAPKNPDANADMHKHFIHYAVMPHEGRFQEADVIRRAYEVNALGANNVPFLAGSVVGAELPVNWVTVDNKAVIVEGFKVASEVERALVVRLYESWGGGSNNVGITMGFDIAKVEECNGLENKLSDHSDVSGRTFRTSFKPFQIRSFLVYF